MFSSYHFLGTFSPLLVPFGGRKGSASNGSSSVLQMDHNQIPYIHEVCLCATPSPKVNPNLNTLRAKIAPYTFIT
jgi:hypothetical protein